MFNMELKVKDMTCWHCAGVITKAVKDIDAQEKVEVKGLTMIKASLCAVVFVLALATPVVSFAQQSNGPLTRAQVRSEIVQLEQAGYDPRSLSVNYPADIQAAEARVTARNDASSSTAGAASGSSASGAPASTADMERTYVGR
jgi:copper chaperone CopZ